MKTYNVSEIFLSIQGEGRSVGSPAVFVRLAGCNRKCEFCDTDHMVQEEMSSMTIRRRVRELIEDCEDMLIVLTGGEPLMQMDQELLHYLSGMGKVCLETNGELCENFSKRFDAKFYDIVLSPKSQKIDSEFLQMVDTFKLLVPYPKELDEEKVRAMITMAQRGGPKELILQPQTHPGLFQLDDTRSIRLVGGDVLVKWRMNCEKALKLSLRWRRQYNENWRVIPQTHRFMEMR